MVENALKLLIHVNDCVVRWDSDWNKNLRKPYARFRITSYLKWFRSCPFVRSFAPSFLPLFTFYTQNNNYIYLLLLLYIHLRAINSKYDSWFMNSNFASNLHNYGMSLSCPHFLDLLHDLFADLGVKVHFMIFELHSFAFCFV